MEELDMESINEGIADVLVEQPTEKPSKKKPIAERVTRLNEEVKSCLKNKRVIVRYIPKSNGVITNTKHVLFGGMSETAVKSYTVPLMRNGLYMNVLTNDEKKFLEQYMGLDPDALSVYKQEDNFWENFWVDLRKDDNIFNLKDPQDYISYKVLLANKDLVAPSLQALLDLPKATYKFVIVEEGEEDEQANKKTSTTMQCYMEYGKYQNNAEVLTLIVETLDGRPLGKNQSLAFLLNKAVDLIQADPKLFLKTIQDEYMDAKILIKSGVESGIISFKAGGYYLRKTNTPLCDDGLDPTLSNAAKYISLAKHLDIMMLLQAGKNKS